MPGKRVDSQPSSVFKLILLAIPCCYGLDVKGNSCITYSVPADINNLVTHFVGYIVCYVCMHYVFSFTAVKSGQNIHQVDLYGPIFQGLKIQHTIFCTLIS